MTVARVPVERFVTHTCFHRFGVQAPPRHCDHIKFFPGDGFVLPSRALASYPVRFVNFRSLKPQVLHRFVHRFPETRLYLPTSEEVRLVLRVVASVRLASCVR